MKNNFKVIGLMSGTSLDGLDLAYCHFKEGAKGWVYTIEKATTLPYSSAWIQKLSTAQHLSAEAIVALDVEYGKLLGKLCKDFIQRNGLKVDFIASHGHTIFHQPGKGFTYQLGNGHAIYASSGLPVIYDFRSLDVMLGGEGAPLVPAGDKFLFGGYDVCLNLGGIANLSMEVKGKRIAYDVCFANMGLNYLMSKTGKVFDHNGELASTGEVHPVMLKKLNKVYNSLRRKRPSLGREIFEQQIKPILDEESIPLADRLSTFVESVAVELTEAITAKKNATVLCTGGGAFNSFLIARVLDHCADRAVLMIPDDEIVKFKEALVFAFLGVLRLRGKVNCLQSVTGASRNTSSGILIGL